MKKMLLCVAVMMLGMTSINAEIAKDTAVYTPTNGYELRSLWIQSEINLNNTQLLTNLLAARGMDVLNGQLLFSQRGGSSSRGNIVVYDGATGNFVKSIPLAYPVFALSDTSATKTVGIVCNDIHVDAAGHVLVSNLETNIIKESFQVWNINLADGTGTKVLDCRLPDLTGTIRIDAFGVYGNVLGDGYIMAAVAGTEIGVGDQVLRWDINGGVVNSEPVFISIKSYYPAATASSYAPRVTPVDKDYFYLDGFTAAPALYDMTGLMVDGFGNAPTLSPIKNGNNGVDEFSINDKNFLIYIFSNTEVTAYPFQSWSLCEFGTGQAFTGMSQYWLLPKHGMGKASNANRVAVPVIEINPAKTVATIYVYATGSGVAAYQFGLTKDLPTGINQEKANGTLQVLSTDNGIKLSEAANVEVFNFAGQKVASNVNASEIALTPGLYIVKAITVAGNSVIEKVIVK